MGVMDMNDMLHFVDLTLGYDRHPAIHHLQGNVKKGDLLAICGPNGAGKSTLLKSIIGILSPLGGEIKCALQNVHHIGYLPQLSQIERTFPINVMEFVSLGLWHTSGFSGGLTAHGQQKIISALTQVGLLGFEARQIGTLSGGQMQRMLFARLILQDSALILLDEPFTGVDLASRTHLMEIIKAWHHEGRTILVVLHDLDLVRTHFPTCLLLAREVVAWGPTKDVLTSEALEKAGQMSEAFDQMAILCQRGIEGERI